MNNEKKSFVSWAETIVFCCKRKVVLQEVLKIAIAKKCCLRVWFVYFLEHVCIAGLIEKSAVLTLYQLYGANLKYPVHPLYSTNMFCFFSI